MSDPEDISAEQPATNNDPVGGGQPEGDSVQGIDPDAKPDGGDEATGGDDAEMPESPEAPQADRSV